MFKAVVRNLENIDCFREWLYALRTSSDAIRRMLCSTNSMWARDTCRVYVSGTFARLTHFNMTIISPLESSGCICSTFAAGSFHNSTSHITRLPYFRKFCSSNILERFVAAMPNAEHRITLLRSYITDHHAREAFSGPIIISYPFRDMIAWALDLRTKTHSRRVQL